jgi:hypothetical protein
VQNGAIPQGDPAPTPVATPDGTQLGADTPDPATATALNGSDPAAEAPADFLAGANADTQKLFQDKQYKSVDDLAKAYSELSSKLGQKPLAPPDAEATAEDWDTFYKAMGRPDTPAEYSYGIPEGVPENLPYDATFADKFKNWSHAAGLSPKQSAALHDQYVKDFAEMTLSSFEQSNKAVGEAHNAIVEKWGDPDTDNYRRNVTLAARALKQLDLQQSFESGGLIEAGTGQVKDANLAFALARVGAKMFAEDELYSGPGGIQNNPFADGSANMTQQSQLIKNDPQRALTLIRAAGKNPKDYGVSAG